MQFQLTRPMRGEPYAVCILGRVLFISTHSPHAGRTATVTCVKAFSEHFNSLAPCGANHSAEMAEKYDSPFQLTRPMRGEPKIYAVDKTGNEFQLTRPMRGEPCVCEVNAEHSVISTHSPHAGRTR